MNPTSGDPADLGRAPGPSAHDGAQDSLLDRRGALDDDSSERLRKATQRRTAFLLILTGAVVLFALAIIIWMSMLSGQMLTDPVSVT